MARATLERFANSPRSLAALSALLVIALFMMNAATQNSHLFGDVYSLLKFELVGDSSGGCVAS